MKIIRYLFVMRDRVSRGAYIAWGLGLMPVKYAGEATIYWCASGRLLDPIQFLSPFLSTRYPDASLLPDWFLPLALLWSLPFIWIGVGLSLRRAVDARLSPWLALIFFVPILNFVLMAMLAAVPSRPSVESVRARHRADLDRLASPLVISFALALLGTGLAWFSVSSLKLYATSLFVGSPLVLGLVQSYALNWRAPRTLRATFGYVGLTIALIHLMMLIFALEGAICLAMSLPISGSMAIIGAFFGAWIAPRDRARPVAPVALLIALPALAWAEAQTARPHTDMVLSVVEINVSPERVWPNVVKFSDLPPSDDWLFKLGVAHPLRARIEGVGVGAIRHCEFSTGAFVEPITVWEEPNRLAFDVRFQPPPMKELSFYDRVDAPHLDGFFRSVRGEFRLIRTASGGTRLEGRTWYEMDMQPGWYWQMYGRWFIHRIHGRVLEHVKALSENSATY